MVGLDLPVMLNDANVLAAVFAGARVRSEHWNTAAGDGRLMPGAHPPQSTWVVTITLEPGPVQAWDTFQSWLSDEECAKTERFRRDDDRWSYAASHALRRLMLATALGITPMAIEYRNNATGRPEFKVGTGALPLQFSTSHTVRGVTCALSPFGSVGADIEWIDPRFAVSDFDALLSSEELVESRNAQGPHVLTRLFQCWTLKEAYLKAAGVGLTVHPQAFSMGVSPPRLIAPPPLLADEGDWTLASWWPSPEHVASIAVRV